MIRTGSSDGVTTITLDRPQKLNALGGTMREDLLAALRAAEGDAACRVVVITGAGEAFCAGGDVEAMAALQRGGDVERFRRLLDTARDVVLQIAAMAKPVIAAINGVAAGAGCNLALACDMRIAADTATLGQTFIRLALHPDWGGTWLLPRLAGPGRALEMMMSGRMVAADEALAIGMVDRVVPAAELARATEALARAIVAGPPEAIAAIKRSVAASRTNDLAAQLELESGEQVRAFQSREARERVGAFLKKSG